MIRNDDFIAWHDAFLDTPLGGPDKDKVAEAHRRNDPDYLLDCPGTCVKTIELDCSTGGFPKHCGILVTYDEKTNYVLVRGHNSPVSPPCVWTGTVAEYRAMWRVD